MGAMRAKVHRWGRDPGPFSGPGKNPEGQTAPLPKGKPAEKTARKRRTVFHARIPRTNRAAPPGRRHAGTGGGPPVGRLPSAGCGSQRECPCLPPARATKREGQKNVKKRKKTGSTKAEPQEAFAPAPGKNPGKEPSERSLARSWNNHPDGRAGRRNRHRRGIVAQSGGIHPGIGRTGFFPFYEDKGKPVFR